MDRVYSLRCISCGCACTPTCYAHHCHFYACHNPLCPFSRPVPASLQRSTGGAPPEPAEPAEPAPPSAPAPPAAPPAASPAAAPAASAPQQEPVSASTPQGQHTTTPSFSFQQHGSEPAVLFYCSGDTARQINNLYGRSVQQDGSGNGNGNGGTEHRQPGAPGGNTAVPFGPFFGVFWPGNPPPGWRRL